MTDDDVIQMMQQAGLTRTKYAPSFRRLIEIAVAAEREACAKVLDDMADDMLREMEPSTAIAYVRSKAAEIRSRGQQ